MTDITTIEEVQAGDYTVRVGQTGGGAGYRAVVTGTDSGRPTGMAGMIVMANESSIDTGDDDVHAPAVTAPHRWVAVGLAIEAYEWDDIGESADAPSDVYEDSAVEGDGLLDLDVMDMTADEIVAELEDGDSDE